jgi:hypothetical protein
VLECARWRTASEQTRGRRPSRGGLHGSLGALEILGTTEERKGEHQQLNQPR